MENGQWLDGKMLNVAMWFVLLRINYFQLICYFFPQGKLLLINHLEMIEIMKFLWRISEENSICFIETSNLDGETNLKIKQVVDIFS